MAEYDFALWHLGRSPFGTAKTAGAPSRIAPDLGSDSSTISRFEVSSGIENLFPAIRWSSSGKTASVRTDVSGECSGFARSDRLEGGLRAVVAEYL